MALCLSERLFCKRSIPFPVSSAFDVMWAFLKLLVQLSLDFLRFGLVTVTFRFGVYDVSPGLNVFSAVRKDVVFQLFDFFARRPKVWL